MVLTDRDIVIEIHRRIADLQTSQDGLWREQRTDLRLQMQETRFHLQALTARISALEQKTARPIIDWHHIAQNIWFKVGLLVVLLSGNAKLIEAVQIAFRN